MNRKSFTRLGFLSLISALLFILSMTANGASFTADSERGEHVFDTVGCVQCHSVNGKGGGTAPDLGQMVDRDFTPATLAATMWNHAPGMWAAMRDRQIVAGELDEQAAQDLMAFFYAARFFEKPGDAARGKRAFESRGCQGCHGLASAVNPNAKPVSKWASLSDPIALLEAMWNHRAEMQAGAAAKGTSPPRITAQELTDMLVYLRNLPDTRTQKTGVFRIEPAASGDAVFQSAGCEKCHKSVAALATSVQGETLTEIAAEMWNHAPLMAAAGAPAVKLAPGQMRDLVSAFWATKFFTNSGHPESGSRVFAAKNCTVCHNDASSGAPRLPAAGRQFSGASMVSVLWRHGPRMLDLMKSKGLEWPRFDGAQMADLIAYLNSGKSGPP
ncbi:MAG: c-type cytochrome [Bryobacteraceae bacterium]